MTTEHLEALTPRNTNRGGARTTGIIRYTHCRKIRAGWPEGTLCGPCFTLATGTQGTCPDGGQNRLLTGPPAHDERQRPDPLRRPLHNFHCVHCALQDDLTALLLTNQANPPTASSMSGAK